MADFSNVVIPNLGISLGRQGNRHHIQLNVGGGQVVPALAFAIHDVNRNEVALLVEWQTRSRASCCFGGVSHEARLYRDRYANRFTDGEVWVDLPDAPSALR